MCVHKFGHKLPKTPLADNMLEVSRASWKPADGGGADGKSTKSDSVRGRRPRFPIHAKAHQREKYERKSTGGRSEARRENGRVLPALSGASRRWRRGRKIDKVRLGSGTSAEVSDTRESPPTREVREENYRRTFGGSPGKRSSSPGIVGSQPTVEARTENRQSPTRFGDVGRGFRYTRKPTNERSTRGNLPADDRRLAGKTVEFSRHCREPADGGGADGKSTKSDSVRGRRPRFPIHAKAHQREKYERKSTGGRSEARRENGRVLPALSGASRRSRRGRKIDKVRLGSGTSAEVSDTRESPPTREVREEIYRRTIGGSPGTRSSSPGIVGSQPTVEARTENRQSPTRFGDVGRGFRYTRKPTNERSTRGKLPEDDRRLAGKTVEFSRHSREPADGRGADGKSTKSDQRSTREIYRRTPGWLRTTCSRLETRACRPQPAGRSRARQPTAERLKSAKSDFRAHQLRCSPKSGFCPRVSDFLRTNLPVGGWVSIDRSMVAALLSTTPRPIPRSSADDLVPPHFTVWFGIQKRRVPLAYVPVRCFVSKGFFDDVDSPWEDFDLRLGSPSNVGARMVSLQWLDGILT